MRRNHPNRIHLRLLASIGERRWTDGTIAFRHNGGCNICLTRMSCKQALNLFNERDMEIGYIGRFIYDAQLVGTVIGSLLDWSQMQRKFGIEQCCTEKNLEIVAAELEPDEETHLELKKKTYRRCLIKDLSWQTFSVLTVLGSGFEVITVGKRKLVRSVPTELKKDHNEILELSQAQGCDVSLRVFLGQVLYVAFVAVYTIIIELKWAGEIIRGGITSFL
ncbi:hypothetical protein QVD17_19701 [Tagetes erecta]|uniref:Uncharacterized protein n=1 Tax=Tagetes erecta TaxID=13708 RepID=A0AAD8KK25_TARER|nr:hypothetical protein QVD17_19701 [Tagetes erecta]